jgi:DUF2934 family protein
MTKAKEAASKRNSKNIEIDKKTPRQMIEKKAYEIYEKRGREHGKDLDDWLEAEKIVIGKKRKSKEAIPS